jgi:hypothetical protein
MAKTKASTLQDAGRTFASIPAPPQAGSVKMFKNEAAGPKKGKVAGSKGPAVSKPPVHRSRSRSR